MKHESSKDNLWGLLAQFGTADELLDAVDQLQNAGYSALEAYTPFPVEGLSERLKFKKSPMPFIILCGGILGGCLVCTLVYWINLYVYPINVGGRPLNSWPSFIPPTFEGVVLVASIFAVFGTIIVCGLPRLHHPVFEIPAFKRSTTDGFFLTIESNHDDWNTELARNQLARSGAIDVWEVPRD